jgi:hypothetical protein
MLMAFPTAHIAPTPCKPQNKVEMPKMNVSFARKYKGKASLYLVVHN